MIFFGLLLALSIYIIISLGVAWFFYHLFESTRAKKRAAGIVMVIALLIPTADHFIGYLILEYYCSREAGVKINEKVTGVEGYYDFSGLAKEDAWYQGYNYVERWNVIKKSYVRYSFDNNGELVETKIQKPISRYAYKKLTKYLGGGIRRSDMSILDLETGRLLAIQSFFGYGGGWVMRELSKAGGSGSFGSCGYKYDVVEFKKNVLKPISPPRYKKDKK